MFAAKPVFSAPMSKFASKSLYLTEDTARAGKPTRESMRANLEKRGQNAYKIIDVSEQLVRKAMAREEEASKPAASTGGASKSSGTGPKPNVPDYGEDYNNIVKNWQTTDDPAGMMQAILDLSRKGVASKEMDGIYEKLSKRAKAQKKAPEEPKKPNVEPAPVKAEAPVEKEEKKVDNLPQKQDAQTGSNTQTGSNAAYDDIVKNWQATDDPAGMMQAILDLSRKGVASKELDDI
jgi:hypothetical protein